MPSKISFKKLIYSNTMRQYIEDFELRITIANLYVLIIVKLFHYLICQDVFEAQKLIKS